MRTAEKAALLGGATQIRSYGLGRARAVHQFAESFGNWGYARDPNVVFVLHSAGADLVTNCFVEKMERAGIAIKSAARASATELARQLVHAIKPVRRVPDMSYGYMTLVKGLPILDKTMSNACNWWGPDPLLLISDQASNHDSDIDYESSFPPATNRERGWLEESDFRTAEFVPSDMLARYVLDQMLAKQVEDRKISEMLRTEIDSKNVMLDEELVTSEADIYLSDAKDLISTSIRLLVNTIAESTQLESAIYITGKHRLLTRVAEAISFRIPVNPYELGDFLTLLVKELLAAAAVCPITCGDASLIVRNGELAILRNMSQYEPVFDWAPEDRNWVKAI